MVPEESGDVLHSRNQEDGNHSRKEELCVVEWQLGKSSLNAGKEQLKWQLKKNVAESGSEKKLKKEAE